MEELKDVHEAARIAIKVVELVGALDESKNAIDARNAALVFLCCYLTEVAHFPDSEVNELAER